MEAEIMRPGFRYWKCVLLMTTAIVTPAIMPDGTFTDVADLLKEATKDFDAVVIAPAAPLLIPVGAALAGTAATATATALGATALAAAIIGTLVSAAITIGAQLLFAPSLDAPTQRKGRTRQFEPHPPFRFAFGEFPLEGSVVFHHTDKKAYYLVYLLNSIASESVDVVKINDGIDLEMLADATNDIYDMAKGSRPATSPWKGDNDLSPIKIWVGLGDHTQMPQEWIDDLGPDGVQDPGNVLTTDKWLGVTVAFVKLKYGALKKAQKRWSQGSPPPLSFMGKWSKVYDPRKDSTSGVTGASGLHRVNDPTTWEYSPNPALCGLTLAFHDLALGFDQEMIPIQQWADAADDCDVQDGGISEPLLSSEDWTGLLPQAQQVDVDAGSDVWTYNRGTVAFGTGTIAPYIGEPILKMFSEDTSSPFDDDELARVGVYFDMQAAGRRGDAPYIWRKDGLFSGEIGVAKGGWILYQADAGGSASDADQILTFMPPDAKNIVEVFDTTIQTVPWTIDQTHEVTGDYVSLVWYGGEPLEEFVELSPQDFYTTAQSAVSRFRCDGVVIIDQRELALLDPVLVTMAAHLDTTNGMLGVRAGVWVAPTDTISLPVGDNIALDGARDSGVDTVRAKFIGRHREWELTDGPGYVLRAGSRIHPLQLALVREPEQASRLEKIFALRAEPNRTLTATWDGRESNRRVGERVTVSMPGFARADGTYVIESFQRVFEDAADGVKVETQLKLVEDIAATYAWVDGDYDEQDSYTPLPPAIPTVDPPTSVAAVQSNYSGAEGAVARLKITVTISAQVSEDADQLEIEVDDGGGFVYMTSIPVVLNTLTYTVHLEPVIVGVTYTARASSVSLALGDSATVSSLPVTIITPALDFSSADFGPEFA